jgi:CRISPR/Cas system-associated protein Cas10 (large subunit of type III CRISPR-Cas system)
MSLRVESEARRAKREEKTKAAGRFFKTAAFAPLHSFLLPLPSLLFPFRARLITSKIAILFPVAKITSRIAGCIWTAKKSGRTARFKKSLLNHSR